MTEQFMDFLIKYLQDCFTNDTDFSDLQFTICEAYDYNQDLSCPQIAIQILNNAENEQYSTFNAEQVSDFGIQFDIFAETTLISGVEYEPKKASSLIADRLKIYMNDLKFKRLNTNIVRLLRNGLDFRTPLDDTGQVYANVIRYDCQSIYPYNKNLENYKGD